MERDFIIKPYDIGYLFFIKCITPIHVGAISGRQMVDKSVQRDNLELPMIFSSSIKGAIRHQVNDLSEICGKKINKKELFGQEPGEPTPRPGSIVFLDARLLFIPAREIDLTYVYVTSPILLHKLFLYYEVIHGKRLIDDEDMNKILVKEGEFKILSTGKDPRNIDKKERLYVNERELICQGILDEKLREKFTNILKIIGIENEPIIIISDKDIVPIANDSTIVYWRNRLKKDMKVVVEGALWSEEYIPDGTVFVSGVFLSTHMLVGEEKKLCEETKAREDARKLLEKILKDKYYFVGGLETIGKGLIKTILFEGDSK